MAYSSSQISGMVGGQLAMFGNNATYARQISPGNQGMPTYQNPFPQTSGFAQGQGATAHMFNAVGSYGIPIAQGAGMMIGGRAGGMLDPTTAAMSSMGRSLGYRTSASFAGNAGTMMSSVGRLGFGGMARAGAFAGAAAAPALIGAQVVKYAAGQMMEGAQFQGQVNQTLQNNFRFTNQQSRSGYGFGQSEQGQIGQMLHTMGTQDVMSTPQEMRRLVEGGSQMGVFRGVQDAKEFKRKFTEMKNSLKEIATTFNTTLEESMPFFQAARQQGFWTPQDITRHAQSVRSVQANTGMSAQQAQAVMGVGASMVRSIGGTGQQGSQMMARAQGMTGAALFSGGVSSQQLQEAGFGLGEQGAQNFGTMLAGSSARFARSRVGRWALASMMNKEGTGLDSSRLQEFSEGNVSIGQIGSRARRNVSGRRAYQFVQNEEQMRGQLAAQGPEATMGIVKSLIGGRLYGESDRDKLITSRMIKRFYGGNKRKGELIAQMMRDLPRTMAVQAARTEGSLDAQGRQRDESLQNTFEGLKRRMGQWWRERVDGPMQRAGAAISQQVGKAWQGFTDRIFGTTGRGLGVSDEYVKGLSLSAETGNMSYLQNVSAGGQQGLGLLNAMGGGGAQVGQGNEAVMQQMGFKPQDTGMNAIRRGGRAYGMFNMLAGAEPMTFAAQKLLGRGQSFSQGDIEEFGNLQSAMSGNVGASEAKALGYGGTSEMRAATSGEGAQQLQNFLRSSQMIRLRGQLGFQGDLSEEQRMNYAKAVTQMVKSGAAGAEAAEMLKGATGRQALARVMSAQGGARGGFTGMGGAFGGVGRGDQMTREQLVVAQEQMSEGLVSASQGGMGSVARFLFPAAGAMEGGIAGVAIDEQGVDELKKNPRGSRAMRLFARAQQLEKDDPDKAAELRSKAREELRQVSLDEDSGLSKSARSLAIKMLDPNNKAVERAAAGVGMGEAMKDEHMFSERVRGRRRRMLERLGGRGMERMLGAAGEGLGGALERALQTSKGLGEGEGASVGEKYINQMKAVVEEAMENPDKARATLAVLQDKGLGQTPIAATLSASLKSMAEADRMGLKGEISGGGRISEKARRGVGFALHQKGISAQGIDVDALIRGTGQDELRKRLATKGYEKPDIEAFLNDVQGGLTRGELRDIGKGRAIKTPMLTHSEKVAKESGLDAGEVNLTGKEGTMKGVEEQLKVHTSWFKRMDANLDIIARKETKPTTSKEDKG